MTRPLRIEYEGALYHITARGNEKKLIFRDQRDHEKFLHVLAELPATSGVPYLTSSSFNTSSVTHIEPRLLAN